MNKAKLLASKILQGYYVDILVELKRKKLNKPDNSITTYQKKGKSLSPKGRIRTIKNNKKSPQKLGKEKDFKTRNILLEARNKSYIKEMPDYCSVYLNYPDYMYNRMLSRVKGASNNEDYFTNYLVDKIKTWSKEYNYNIETTIKGKW